MKKSGWKKRIVNACEEAGTYQPYFESVIDTLADIMEKRDMAQIKFEESGGDPVVEHINRAGASNLTKNPALVMIMECNAQALAYWRDLGLTPAGLKRLGEKNLVEKNSGGSLAEALANLGI